MREDYKRKIKYLDDAKLCLELLDVILGDFIGSGVYREVFQHPHFIDYVVKIEQGNSRENAIEWDVWNSVKFTDNAKWFAPCTYISDNGVVLIQKKTKPLFSKPVKFVPEKIPSFFTDIKPDNFGWIGNQLVAHDYSFTAGIINSNVAASKKMQTTNKKLKNLG